MRTSTMVERFFAEALGTFLLTFIGGGTAALVGLSNLSPKGSGAAGLVLVALAHGLALFIIVMIVGRISGAHVNPAITLGLALVRRFPWEEVPAYLFGQIVGGVVGAAAILVVYGNQAATLGHLGAPALAINTSLLQGLVVEAIGAAILMMAIIATAVDTRGTPGWAGLTIGLALGAIIMVLGPATGAAINPARALGPDFMDFVLGVKVDWLAYLVVYLVGPIIGAAAGAFLYVYIAYFPAPRMARK
jgi:glycerol uptake facilitator